MYSCSCRLILDLVPHAYDKDFHCSCYIPVLNSVLSLVGRIACCHNISYNPNEDTCCDGKVNSNVAFGYCCGKQAYLSSQSTCCEGQLTHVPSIRGAYCCGSRAYEPVVQVCCGGKLVETNGTDVRCCCGRLACTTFQSNSQVCCSNGNVMKKRENHLCCAGEHSQKLYDPTTEVRYYCSLLGFLFPM